MEVMVAVQSGTLLHALRVQLKRRILNYLKGEQEANKEAAELLLCSSGSNQDNKRHTGPRANGL